MERSVRSDASGPPRRGFGGAEGHAVGWRRRGESHLPRGSGAPGHRVQDRAAAAPGGSATACGADLLHRRLPYLECLCQRLQAGHKHRLQAGKAERLILMATQGDASSKRKAKSNDPGWKYGYWPVIGNRNLVECVLCGYRVNAGIKRLKEHLVGGYGDAIKCPKIQMIS